MKKILSVLLVLVMAISLIATFSACGGGTSSNPNGGDSNENSDPYADLKTAQIGDYIKFGSFEQGNGKESVEWRILDKQDGKILVISKYILDYRQYHTEEKALDWEDCALRAWLNDDFLNSAFSDEEKAMIASTFTESFAYDKVFLLSAEEAEDYLHSDWERTCTPTEYADSHCNGRNLDSREWWLRSDTKGYFSFVRDYVDKNGEIWAHHAEDPSGVRPAMWIDLNA